MKTLSELSLPAVMKWSIAFFVAQWFEIEEASRAMITTLIILMVIDYMTGLLAGFVSKSLSSSVGARGLATKGLTLALILTVHILERRIGREFHLELVGAVGYCVNEAISIVENCAKGGVRIGAPLVNALLAVKHLRPKAATPEQLRALADDMDVAKGEIK